MISDVRIDLVSLSLTVIHRRLSEGHMQPVPAMDEGTDAARGNPKLMSQLPLEYPTFGIPNPYLRYIRLSELGDFPPLTSSPDKFGVLSPPTSLPRGATALLRHVKTIVLSCSQKQMVRAHARGVIAVVANVQPRRDWAILDLPGQAMRLCSSFFLAAIYRAVSVLIRGTFPDPTGVGLPHLHPEAILYRNPTLGSTSAFPPAERRQLCNKPLPTLNALARYFPARVVILSSLNASLPWCHFSDLLHSDSLGTV
jgi:hypothetical protein